MIFLPPKRQAKDTFAQIQSNIFKHITDFLMNINMNNNLLWYFFNINEIIQVKHRAVFL